VTERQNNLTSVYEQTQHALFVQILRAMRIGVILVLVISGGALIVPALRTAPIVLLVGTVVAELGVTELSYWLVRRGRALQGAIVYMMLTLILATIVAVVLHLPAFIVAITALMVAMAALLIGARYALVPGVTGIGCFVLLVVAGQQGWFERVEVPQTADLLVVVQLGFVVLALGVVVAVSMLTSDRLRQHATEAQLRAEEAERARSAQTTLTEQLATQVAEQRQLLGIIQELEVPVVPVLEGVLVLPLVSHLDSQRLQAIERQVLDQVGATRADLLLVDVTGVPVFDTIVAKGIVQMGQALRLLGTQMALTGLKAPTAQALVQLGADLGGIKTYAAIQDALLEYQR
jgi:rsbT co-antagonist protein RsbR